MTKSFFLTVALISTNIGDSGWIDPDSVSEDVFIKSYHDGRTYELVFSDEFNVDGRLFKDGQDPRWTAIHKDDYTNFALHYYNSDLARTSNGKLNISTIIEDVSFGIDVLPGSNLPKHKTKNYQSGMIQGWNKFCFTGGIIEMSAQLPGKWNIGGLWPAMWLLGNLARATYVGSSNNVWPWSYDTCFRSKQHQQEISACKSVNYYGLHSYQGRGAPEIDILEAMSGNEKLINTKVHRPYFSTSLQIAPGLESFRPDVATRPPPGMWYDHGLEYDGNNETDLNVFFYGMHLEGATADKSYIADAISANTNLYETHFTELHKYRLEWQPGENGYLKWYLDDQYLYGIYANALNKTGGIIPEEPMYLLLNTAVSSTWGFPVPCPEGCACDCYDPRKEECGCALPAGIAQTFPAYFLLDYVRVYQDKGDASQLVGCSTASHPTSTFIKGQAHRYKSKTDKQLLLPVQRGGAKCNDDSNCGGGAEVPTWYTSGRGSCVKGLCQCSEKYTGPFCQAAAAQDDIIWDIPDAITLETFAFPIALAVLALFLLSGLILSVIWRFKEVQLARTHQQPPSDSYWSFLFRNSEWHQGYTGYSELAQEEAQQSGKNYEMRFHRLSEENNRYQQ